MKAVFISMSDIPGIKRNVCFWWLVTQKKMELPSNSVKVIVVFVLFFPANRYF